MIMDVLLRRILFTWAIIVELLVVLEADQLLLASKVLDDLGPVPEVLVPEGAVGGHSGDVLGGEAKVLHHARQPDLALEGEVSAGLGGDLLEDLLEDDVGALDPGGGGHAVVVVHLLGHHHLAVHLPSNDSLL